MRVLSLTFTFFVASFAGAVAAVPVTNDDWEYCSKTMRLDIADSSTWVSIARVNLKITDLSLEEGRLTGKYDMKVPLFSSNDECGMIDLSFNKPIIYLRENGGKMKGVGIKSDETDTKRGVSCEIFPNQEDKDSGRIVLKIDTGERILTFDTTYVVEPREQSS